MLRGISRRNGVPSARFINLRSHSHYNLGRSPPFSSLISKHYMSFSVRPAFQIGRFILASTGTAAAFGAYKASGNSKI